MNLQKVDFVQVAKIFMDPDNFEFKGEDRETMEKISRMRENKNTFHTIKKEIGIQNLKKFLRILYPTFTITQIEKILKIPDSTLCRWFAELEIPFRRHRISNIAVAGNENKEEIEEKNGKLYLKHTIKITPELAYIIGFTLGDGTVQKFQVEVFNKDEKLREVLLNYLMPYGPITKERRNNGLWRLRLSKVLIADLIKRNKKIRKDTLEYILTNDELAKKFIAAFWDAEGSVLRQKNYFHVYLYNSNKELLEKIGEYLNFKKIYYSIIDINSKERSYSLNGRKIISKKQLHRLGIPKKSLNIWANEIGVHLFHSKKSEMVKNILALGRGI